MQRLEVNGALRPIYGSLGVKRLSLQKGLLCISRCVCKFNGQVLLRQPAGISVTLSALV